MKNVITFLMCSLCIITGIAQSDLSGNSLNIPERTPELKALYEQAKALEENGTAAEINANRLAIKNAWQDIDPNVAALYKPIITNRLPETVENLPINGVFVPNEVLERDGEGLIPEWGNDQLLRDDYVDAVDMDKDRTSDNIYIGMYENIIDFGGTFDSIFIYRSQDGGLSFDEWKKVGVTAPMRKMQLITYDDSYLIAYLVTDSKNFQAWRWDTSSGAFDAQVIASDVIDFGVGTNYPGAGTQRSFATYEKSDHTIYSARSTTGSSGFDWIDENSLSIVGEQVEFAYGYTGGCYTTFIGFNSRSIRANVNSDFNDPASWGSNETVTDGTAIESLNPTICAARKGIATDEVLIIASSRAAGSTDKFDGQAYRRESGAAYAPLGYINTSAGYNIAHIDSWMQKVNGSEIMETSYVRDIIDNSDIDVNRSHKYDGTAFGPFEEVNDSDVDVFDGFASAVAETPDNNPCMAFAGTSAGGTFGYGLYFDAQNATASTEENNFEGFTFYPNPAGETLNLSATRAIENVTIYSLLGQKVFETSPQQIKPSINISSIASGIYVMNVNIEGQSSTYKIIKQ